jgi:hypothetical protein
MKDTNTSTATAIVVIREQYFIREALRTKARTIAMVDDEKNIRSSVYQRNFPGLKTNQRFISQQNMFAITNPTPVATENLKALKVSAISTEGRFKSLTAISSAFRH